MKTLTAKDAKSGFGRLIDLTRAEPVAGNTNFCLGAARRPPPRARLRPSQRFCAGGQGSAV
jgi:hypothetical protein